MADTYVVTYEKEEEEGSGKQDKSRERRIYIRG